MKTQIQISSFLFLLLLTTTTTTTKAAGFTCSSTATCRALAGYVPSSPTTLKAIQSLFQVSHLSLLSSNNLPSSTLSSHQIPGNSTFLIPFPCKCSNGTGRSDHTPMYTVGASEVGLDDIARNKFGQLVAYQDIGDANKLKDVNVIVKGEKLWIPLPCSCDEVGGSKVVHLGHVVAAGSSVAGIAAEFGTTEATLLKLNGIQDPKMLLAGQVLDVPLKACSSSISSEALDHNLLLANDSYALTADNCIQCSCSSTSYQLACHPIQGLNKSTCPVSKCGALYIGNSTGAGCDAMTCVYQGYTNSTGLKIMSNLTKQSCNIAEAPVPPRVGGPPPAGGSSAGRLGMNGYQIRILFLIQIALFWFNILA